MRPRFFDTPAAFRAWLAKHHATSAELLVGFYKRASGKPSMTWPESVDQALCFGWIDGVRRRIDDDSYTIRFTPRRDGSIWSAVNVKKVEALIANGQMQPAGLAAFAKRQPHKTAIYSFERPPAVLEAEDEARFRRNRKAWTFFIAQAPWYQRTAIHWATSAKREETRERRLTQLIADSAAGRRIGVLDYPRKKS